MKIILRNRSLAVIAIVLLAISAVRAEQARLVISTKSGEIAVFPIADNPTITYQDNLLKVVAGGEEISVDAENVAGFDFFPSEGSGVDSITVDGSHLSMLQPGTPVDVYTFEGQHVASFKADNSGSLIVNLGDLPPGYYIIRTPNSSFKIKTK